MPRKEILFTHEPEKIPFPYRVVDEYSDGSFEIEVDFPDDPLYTSPELELLKKIAEKLGVSID